jgi:phage terminase small subunit
MGKQGAGRAAAAKKPAAPVKKQSQRGGKVSHGSHTPAKAGPIPAAATKPKKPGSSTVEHSPDKREVAGSTPAPATTTHPAAVLAHLAGLKPGPRRFAVEYLRDQNATMAYIRAGYSARGHSAEAAAGRLLRNVEVSSAIVAAQDEMLVQVQAATGITLQRTLEFIARGAYHDPRKFFKPNGELVPIVDLDDETAVALAGFEVTETGGQGENAVARFISKAKIADRKGYLDMLMKHLGGYKKDNEQTQTPLGEALRGFLDSLHQSGSRLPMAPRT